MGILVRKVSAHCQYHVSVILVCFFLVPQVIDQIIRLIHSIFLCIMHTNIIYIIYNILLYAHTANGAIYEKNMHKDCCGKRRGKNFISQYFTLASTLYSGLCMSSTIGLTPHTMSKQKPSGAL